MVCSVSSGRMAVMARLLEVRSFSHNVAGYVGNEKLVAQYIRKEILEADEPNLLDEEDMHVFGLKPMDDPLHLVCCSSCKKPVKASHYAVHTDLCRVLSSTRDAKIEPNYSTERRKPPQRKQRGQVFSVANLSNPLSILHEDVDQLVAGREQEIGSRMDPHDSITSESHDDKELSSFSTVVKAGSYPRYTLPGSREINHNDVDRTSYRDLRYDDVQNQNVSAPLATKIYYSQRNNRLRSEIGQMFRAADSHELDYNLTPQATQQDITQPNFSNQSSYPPGQNSDARLMMAAGKVNLADGSSNQLCPDEALRQEASSTIPRGSTQQIMQRTDGGATCTDIYGQPYF